MRLLLDTHIFLWFISNDARLSKTARGMIRDAETVLISSVSIWEAAIKAALGKLEVDMSQLAAAIGRSGFTELPIYVSHAVKVRELPQLHRDPFDRMLIAQALCGSLQLLTSDRHLAAYSELVTLV